MKLKYTMVTTQVGDRFFATPADDENGMRKMLTLNETAAAMLALFSEETTIDAVVAEMKKQFDVDEKRLRSDAEAFVGQLSKEDLMQ